MDAHDLLDYLALVAPPDITWSQMCNLVRIRRAHGRPISAFGYEAIRATLAADEARSRR